MKSHYLEADLLENPGAEKSRIYLTQCGWILLGRGQPRTVVSNAGEKLPLRFDCKPCEMHARGKLKPALARQTVPLTFYKTRP